MFISKPSPRPPRPPPRGRPVHPVQPVAAGADVRGAVLHHDPAADEAPEGTQGDGRGHRPKVTRWSSPAAYSGASPRSAKPYQCRGRQRRGTAGAARLGGPGAAQGHLQVRQGSSAARSGARTATRGGHGRVRKPHEPLPAVEVRDPGVALLIGLVYTAPNFFGEAPGCRVQRQGHAEARRGLRAASAAGARAGRAEARLRAVRRQFGQGAVRRHRRADQGQGRDSKALNPDPANPSTSSR